MLDTPEAPKVAHHAEAPETSPAGSTIHEIIDKHWRKYCKDQGLDPDNLPPSQPPRYQIVYECRQSPSGLFEMHGTQVPAKKYVDILWLSSPVQAVDPDTRTECAVWPLSDGASMPLILQEMEQEEVDIVIVAGIEKSECPKYVLEALTEALQQGVFAFSLVVVSDSTEALFQQIGGTTGEGISFLETPAGDIALRGQEKGFKVGLLQL